MWRLLLRSMFRRSEMAGKASETAEDKQNMEQRIVTKPSFYTNIMLLSIPIILQQF